MPESRCSARAPQALKRLFISNAYAALEAPLFHGSAWFRCFTIALMSLIYERGSQTRTVFATCSLADATSNPRYWRAFS